MAFCIVSQFAYTQASGNIDLGSEITSGITTGGCTSGCIPTYCSTVASSNHTADTKTITISGIPATDEVSIVLTSVNCNPGTSGLDSGDDIFINGTKVFDGSGNALVGQTECVVGGADITIDVITNRRDEIVNVSWSSGPIGTVCPVVPVELISFEAIRKTNEVDLNWSTASEINNDYFAILHSTNGEDFEMIDKIDGHGNSAEVIKYSFTHSIPKKGINYYKLRQVDFDGSYEYSSIETVRIKEINEISVYPNPVQNELTISLQEEAGQNLSINIFDISGRVVLDKVLSVGTNTFKIDLNELQKGNYLIRVEGNSIQYSKRFVKI